MRVRLSEEARAFLRTEGEYLRTEGEYLRHRSPAAARRLLDRMRQARMQLGDFPMMGSASDEGPVPGTPLTIFANAINSSL